ncbi:MAG: NAD-dependent succinate-semialdehyde dehydrogenase [Hyphomicrobiales bacterium]
MAYEKLELLINGEWTSGTSGKSEAVINPATEEVLGDLPHASAADLDAATDAAVQGFHAWRGKTAVERQGIMEKAARLLEDRTDSIAENLTKEMGKPVAEAKIELGFAISVLRWYAEEGKRAYGRLVPPRVPGMRQMVLAEPVGPVAAFVAWNFPAVNVMRKIGGALGAGCSIVIKASEETPATCIAIGRCLQEAGLPAGVLNIVFGVPDDVSRHLLAKREIRKLSFTGSVPVGIHLQKLAADTLKRCTMELGGHSPVIVFEDANVKEAARQAAGFKFRNAGQVCISPTRFYVQEKVYEEFADEFVAAAKEVKVGNGMDDGVAMGPLIAERRLGVIQGFVDDAKDHGAEVLLGGERMGNQGFFFAPTVLKDVPEDAAIMNEEPFGPVAPLASFHDADEVLARANKLEFGLASYLFTEDGKRAAHFGNNIEAGMMSVNSFMVSTPETPFGGINDSGYGSEGGIEGLDAYLRTKFVTEIGV